ncbi:MAG: GNAT family N-acetyltransferase [Pyrinomonadaceae bacterium]|nr:GNAT family N-acetyltransferase [Pyrinomonadaceae bacterium]
MADAFKIRPALGKDAATMTGIAHDAKRHWGYPEHWIQHWQEDLTISSDFISNNQVYVAELEGEIIGFYALVVRADKAELEHMWVAPNHIGKGVGKELFIHAMQRAAGDKVSEIEISADPNAEGFYKRMGARGIGEVSSEIDGQPRRLPRLVVDPTST